MADNQSDEQEVQARVESLVSLHKNSVSTEPRDDDKNVLVWVPPEGNVIDWGKSKPITFIKNRFLPSNVYETGDIQVFSEMSSLNELGLFMDYWDDAKDLLLQDKSPVVVIDESEKGDRQTQLKVLRVIEKDGTRKMYYVDPMQTDNLTAVENPSYGTEITDENSNNIYPTVVKVKDLRNEFKGIGPQIENKVVVRFLSFGNVDLNGAQKQYLKPLIAKAEQKLWGK